MRRLAQWPISARHSERRPVPNQSDELGALWEKTGAKGTYFTGTITGIGAVVVFRNTRKTAGSKQPDWRILRSKPKAETTRAEEWD